PWRQVRPADSNKCRCLIQRDTRCPPVSSRPVAFRLRCKLRRADSGMNNRVCGGAARRNSPFAVLTRIQMSLLFCALYPSQLDKPPPLFWELCRCPIRNERKSRTLQKHLAIYTDESSRSPDR